MKKFLMIFCFLSAFPGMAYSKEPLTSCPAGTVAVETDYMYLTSDSSCGAENPINLAANFLNIYSCVENDKNVYCFLYAPADTQYTDTIGKYLYTEDCQAE